MPRYVAVSRAGTRRGVWSSPSSFSQIQSPAPFGATRRLAETLLLSTCWVNSFPPWFQIKTSQGWGLGEGSGRGGNAPQGVCSSLNPPFPPPEAVSSQHPTPNSPPAAAPRGGQLGGRRWSGPCPARAKRWPPGPSAGPRRVTGGRAPRPRVSARLQVASFFVIAAF